MVFDWRVVPLTEAVRSWPESRREQIYLLDARGQRDVRPLARRLPAFPG